ncbi:unnamed protein product [Orchesella dallaii]|uniref:Uncharacterized protein n=1 Tax=Orchesella dallaii TaxID=48710 RepID=A0ABP1QAL3_9HEXA
MSNPTKTGASGPQTKSEPSIRRTTISETGAITTKSIPISSLRREAMDLSENSPTSLLLTREAAMRVTEVAITTAIANTWKDLMETERNKNSESPAKKQDDRKITTVPNNTQVDSINHKSDPKKVPERTKSNQSSAPAKLPNSEKTSKAKLRQVPSTSGSKRNSKPVPKTKSSPLAHSSKTKKGTPLPKDKSGSKNNIPSTPSATSKKP